MNQDDNNSVENQAYRLQLEKNKKLRVDIETLHQELKNVKENFEDQSTKYKIQIKNLEDQRNELKPLFDQKQERLNQLTNEKRQVGQINQELKLKHKEIENEAVMAFDFSTKSTEQRQVNQSQSNNYTIYTLKTVGQKKTQFYILRAQ